MLPKVVSETRLLPLNEWNLSVPKGHGCYLYGLKALGVTPAEYAELIAGQEALVFEKPYSEQLRIISCPWCEYNSRDKAKEAHLKKGFRGIRIEDHIAEHNKNFVDAQVVKFQNDLYTMKLQLVRKGYHAALHLLVNHECQLCVTPRVKGRKGMCALPTSSRNRPRSLELLGYPIEHLLELRTFDWSVLGVVVLLKS